MKNGKKATQTEKNYALRRVVYNLMVGAKSLLVLADVKKDFSRYEGVKITALIIARNLNEFFFFKTYKHDDDIRYNDFDLTDWKPDAGAKLTYENRISKICGHIVTSKPMPYKNPKEIIKILHPLFKQSSEFIRLCIKTGAAKYTGTAWYYVVILNDILPIFEIEKLPEPPKNAGV